MPFSPRDQGFEMQIMANSHHVSLVIYRQIVIWNDARTDKTRSRRHGEFGFGKSILTKQQLERIVEDEFTDID